MALIWIEEENSAGTIALSRSPERSLEASQRPACPPSPSQSTASRMERCPPRTSPSATWLPTWAAPSSSSRSSPSSSPSPLQRLSVRLPTSSYICNSLSCSRREAFGREPGDDCSRRLQHYRIILLIYAHHRILLQVNLVDSHLVKNTKTSGLPSTVQAE